MSTLTPTPAVVPLYAGFWRRFAAVAVDSVILVIPNLVATYALPPDSVFTTVAIVLIACAYYAGFHASQAQATPGKRAFGIKVTDLEGGRIGPGRAVLRYFATWLSTITLFIGFAMAGFTKRRQALHDLLARTLVVNRAAGPGDVTAGGGVMPATAGVWIVAVFLVLLPFAGGIVAAIAIPAYQDYTVRAKLHEVVAAAAPVRGEVESAMAGNRAIPAGRTSIASPHIRSVSVLPDGAIAIALAPDVVAGGRIFLTPTMEGNRTITWSCNAEGIQPKYLPAQCRR